MDSIVTIPWSDGSGDNLYLSLSGGSVEITSDSNWSGSVRVKTLTFTTTIGSANEELLVTQGVGADGVVVARDGVIANYGGVVPLYQEALENS